LAGALRLSLLPGSTERWQRSQRYIALVTALGESPTADCAGSGSGNYRGDGVLFERMLEDLIERPDVGDLQVAENIRRKIGDWRSVRCPQAAARG